MPDDGTEAVVAEVEVEETPAETDEQSKEEERVVSFTEHQGVQRKLTKTETQLREARKELAQTTTLSTSERARQDKFFDGLVDVLSSNELFDGVKDKLVGLKAESDRTRPQNEAVASYMADLTEAIGDDNFNSDAKYERARDLHRAGDLRGVLDEVRRANAPAPQDAETVKAELKAEILKELGRVDTGTSTAGPAPSDANFLEDFGSGKLPLTKENIEKAVAIGAKGGDEPLIR